MFFPGFLSSYCRRMDSSIWVYTLQVSTCTCRVYMDVLYKQAQMWRYVITYKQLEKVFNWFASNLIGIWRMYEHFNWEYVVNQGFFSRVSILAMLARLSESWKICHVLRRKLSFGFFEKLTRVDLILDTYCNKTKLLN